MSFVQDLKNALLNLPPSRNVPFSTKMRTFTIAASAMTLSSAQRPLQDDTERVPPRMLRSLAVEGLNNDFSLPAGAGDDASSGKDKTVADAAADKVQQSVDQAEQKTVEVADKGQLNQIDEATQVADETSWFNKRWSSFKTYWSTAAPSVSPEGTVTGAEKPAVAVTKKERLVKIAREFNAALTSKEDALLAEQANDGVEVIFGGSNEDEIMDTMNPMKKTTRWASFKAFLANLWVKFISLFTKTAKVV